MINVVAKYFILFMIYSFIGWCMEVLTVLIPKKKFVNRGFLIGPYCPIYGYGCLLIMILLKNNVYDNKTEELARLRYTLPLNCALIQPPYTAYYPMEMKR